MATQTFNLPRREDYTRIAAAIESQNDLLRGHFKAAGESIVKSWEGFRNLCRAGGIRTYYAVGDQLQCKKGDATLTWDIVDIQDIESTGGNRVTLMLHNSFTTISFEPRQAIFQASQDIPAGTYHFKTPMDNVTDTAWTTNRGWTKTWQLTTTKTIPKGGVLCFTGGDMNYDTDFTQRTVSSYSNNASTTVIETMSITEASGGTDLATLGSVNHGQRVCWGSNHWATSAFRQWLNSDKAANAWWTAQTKFSRPSERAGLAGWMNGIDSDFLAVVTAQQITTKVNGIAESGGTETTLDKFWVPCQRNMNMDSDATEDTHVWEYFTKFRQDGKTGVNTGADSNRARYSLTGSLPWYWLRTPDLGTACVVGAVGGDGDLHWGGAYNTTYAAVPACAIE